MSELLSRSERKARTRRHILDVALRQSSRVPLAAMSLRAVAKEVGLAPASLYRHFDSAEALGVALVDEVFGSLRSVLRDVRRDSATTDDTIRSSVEVLLAAAESHRDDFAFIARERYAGPPAVREAIQQQFSLFVTDLAIDLARRAPDNLTSDDLRILSRMVVAAMVSTVADYMVGNLASLEEARAQAEQELRMLLVAALNWRADG